MNLFLVLASAKRYSRTYVLRIMLMLIVLCDLNVKLSGNVDGVTGDVVHKMLSKELENREMGCWSLMNRFNMKVLNTFKRFDEDCCFTRVPWGEFGFC